MIKTKFIHNGLGELDPTGSYVLFTVEDRNFQDPTEKPRSLTFLVSKHQLKINDIL